MQIEEGKYYRTRDGRKAGPASEEWKTAPVCQRFTVPQSWNGHPATYSADGKRNCYVTGPDPLDLIAEWKDEPTGPVTIETVKRINSGTFGRVSVGQTNPIGAAKATTVLVGVTTESGGSSFNVAMDASELRAAADVFIQLADALEGK